MKVGIVVNVDTYETMPPEDSDSMWAYRGETDGSISSVEAYADSTKGTPYWSEDFELDVDRGDTVYPVVATYETGDTFGRDGGQTDVMDVFKTHKEALEFVDWINSIAHDDYRRGHTYAFTEEYNGKSYHIPWRGYFERFQMVDIYPVTVK